MFNEHFQKNHDRKPDQLFSKERKTKTQHFVESSNEKLFTNEVKNKQTYNIKDFSEVNMKTMKNNIVLSESTKNKSVKNQTLLKNIIDFDLIEMEKYNYETTHPLINCSDSKPTERRSEIEYEKNKSLNFNKNQNLEKSEVMDNSILQEGEHRIFSKAKGDFNVYPEINSFVSKNNEYLRKIIEENSICREMFESRILDQIDLKNDEFLNFKEKLKKEAHFMKLCEINRQKLKEAMNKLMTFPKIMQKNHALNMIKAVFSKKKDFETNFFYQKMKQIQTQFMRFAIMSPKTFYFLKNLDLKFNSKKFQNYHIFFGKLFSSNIREKKIQKHISNSTREKNVKTGLLYLLKTVEVQMEKKLKSYFQKILQFEKEHKKFNGLSENAKNSPSMALIVKQLSSINKKIGSLKTNFHQNEENNQKIKMISELALKTQNSKMYARTTNILQKNKSNEDFFKSGNKLQNINSNKKSLNEALKEQNFNLVKFLEKQRIDSTKIVGLAESTYREDSQITMASGATELERSQNLMTNKEDGSQSGKFIGIRDIYF